MLLSRLLLLSLLLLAACGRQSDLPIPARMNEWSDDFKETVNTLPIEQKILFLSFVQRHQSARDEGLLLLSDGLTVEQAIIEQRAWQQRLATQSAIPASKTAGGTMIAALPTAIQVTIDTVKLEKGLTSSQLQLHGSVRNNGRDAFTQLQGQLRIKSPEGQTVADVPFLHAPKLKPGETSQWQTSMNLPTAGLPASAISPQQVEFVLERLRPVSLFD